MAETAPTDDAEAFPIDSGPLHGWDLLPKAARKTWEEGCRLRRAGEKVTAYYQDQDNFIGPPPPSETEQGLIMKDLVGGEQRG